MVDSITDLKSIFGNALAIASPADRKAYLDQACAGNAALRAEVEALLEASADAGQFLDPPPRHSVATVDEPLHTESPGTVIGLYKLIEPIGEGGMGTVWMAQQTEPVRRLVAVKLIKAGMDSKQVIARFEAERQALALMDHPNIAKVLDAGTTSTGRPYFVMDLVKGVPITKYCDEHHLTPRQRLELFIPVCQAVQHAHQKGIIHRDLKPSNVLVAHYDGKPVPKVIDFGVAKAAGQSLTDKTLVTGFGNIVGTLEYMSPEQAEVNQLDIDTRSDIYSLGVLLYELLAGSPPFTRKELEKAGMLEMLRVIREQEPSKPSTKLSTAEGLPTLAANRGTEPAKLTRLVRGELDWIVMKALEKDRNRRYETANGFAMDVQRYLADEPVQACPPSAGYRLRKFIRRNKGPVLAASLILVVVVAGIVGTTLGMFRATEAEADAKREAGEKTVALAEKTVALGEKEAALATAKANELQAKAAQKDAQENLKDAVGAVDQMLTRVAQDRLRYVPQMETVRRELLQDAVNFYKRFLEKNGDDPTIRKETARAYRRLADLHRILGQLAESELAFRKAFALFEKLEAQAPLELSTREDLVSAHLEFAATRRALGKREEEEQHVRRAVRIAEQLLSEAPQDRYGDTLANANLHLAQYLATDEREKLVRRNLTLAKQPWVLAHLYQGLGALLGAQGRYPEAEEAASQAVKLWEQVSAHRPSENWPQTALGVTLGQLADWVAGNGRLQEAAEFYGRAVTVLDKVAADFPAIHEYRFAQSLAHHRYAGVLKKLNRRADAEKSYRHAVDLFEKLAADFPTIPRSWQTDFDLRLDLGQVLKEAGKLGEAGRVYQEAGSIASKLPTDDQGRFAHWTALARTQVELGQLLTAAGKNQDAEAAYREALAIRDRLEKEFADKPGFQRDLAASHLATGLALWETRRMDEVIKSFHMALNHAQKWVDAEPQARESRTLLANICLQLASKHRWNTGQLEESEKAARKAQALYDGLMTEFGEDFNFARDGAECVYLLANVAFLRKQFPKAEDLCRQSIARCQKILDWPDHLRTANELAWTEYQCGVSHMYLARTLAHLDRPKEAAQSFERALSFIRKSTLNPTMVHHRFVIRECHTWYGLFLAESGRADEAKKQFDHAYDRGDAGSLNSLAWKLAAHPNPRVHKSFAALAVELATAADKITPEKWAIVNTLGAALYRADDWKSAVAALEKSIALGKGGDSNDWFFLAMAHGRLGEKDKARQWYDRAVDWMDKNQPNNGELRRFRTEAAELLELSEKK